MVEDFILEYQVSVTGLGEAAIAAENAGKSADQAQAAMSAADSQGSRTLPVLMSGIRALNSTRLAVEQTSRAIERLDPMAALYAFLSMVSVVRNLTSLMKMLKESTGAASAAQAILATLTGRWWLIPLAIAAGAIIYAKIKSMQEGGVVPETGLYVLHRGEEVVPRHVVELKRVVEERETHAETRVLESTRIYSSRTEAVAHHRHLHTYGPIYVTFERQPREGPEADRWLRELGPMIVQRARRGG